MSTISVHITNNAITILPFAMLIQESFPSSQIRPISTAAKDDFTSWSYNGLRQ